MSSKVSQKKIEYSEISIDNAPQNPRKNFTWGWLPNERIIIILLTIAVWGYFFFKFLLLNQKMADQIQGLSEGFFGLKRVILYYISAL